MTEYILNGSRFIKRIIRPPRVAIVVNSLEDADKFISIASLSWGGRHFLAIPCTDDGKISDEWFEVLKKYNPDSIRTFCELPQDTKEMLWKSRFIVNKINEQAEIKIEDLNHDWRGNERIPEFFGQPIINFMLLDEFYGANKDKVRLTYIPLGSNFDFYYKARYSIAL